MLLNEGKDYDCYYFYFLVNNLFISTNFLNMSLNCGAYMHHKALKHYHPPSFILIPMIKYWKKCTNAKNNNILIIHFRWNLILDK